MFQVRYLLLFFLFSMTLHSEDNFPHRLQGSFKLESFPDKEVIFELKWSEHAEKIEGTYSDNLFASSAPVSGLSNDLGKTFIVGLTKKDGKTGSMTFLMPEKAGLKKQGSLPFTVVIRDEEGTTLTTSESLAAAVKDASVAQKEEEACGEEMGLLAKFCGVYTGMISEDKDRHQSCDLLAVNLVRLELDAESNLTLHLDRESDVFITPLHKLGRLPIRPASTSIDVLNRECSRLPGTVFPGDNCKRLHLRGSFIQKKNARFRGTYQITDEVTGRNCTYGLSFDRF